MIDEVALFTGGREHRAPVLERGALLAGDTVRGPALIREAVDAIAALPK